MMKNWLLALNIILLVAVAVLFYLYFSPRKAGTTERPSIRNTASTEDGKFKMAYFEMDSLDQNFHVMKDVSAELSKKQEAKAREIAKLQDDYQRKLAEYMNSPLNQEQSEQATNDLKQRQQYINGRMQALDQEYNDFYMRKHTEVTKMIVDFLKEYNQEKNYSYIIMYEPGIVYYKDSIYNITGDLVKGLNKKYSKKD
jgi:outer membrane protein